MGATINGAVTPGLRNLASRARGVFLGAAVGDALGWPQEQNSGIVGGNRNRAVAPTNEFRAWDRYGGSQYFKYIEPVAAGEYSDDTQLMLATARAVLSPDWFIALVNTELPLFLLYQRGAGGATLRACRSWATGSPPWESGTTQRSRTSQQKYFNAGGNGVAMRVAPHVIVGAGDRRRDLVARVIRDGVTTHGHPRALVGAAVYAAALHSLLNAEGPLGYGDLASQLLADDSWQSLDVAFNAIPSDWSDAAARLQPDVIPRWDTVVEETQELLSHAAKGMKSGILGNDLDVLDTLGCFDRRINGAGTVTAVGAIYLASRNAPRPRSGLVRAAYLQHADTDTMASMTAGLLGALHGPDWLESLSSQVQDRDYIARLADQCTGLALGESSLDSSDVLPVRADDVISFRERLEAMDEPPAIMPGGRSVLSTHKTTLESHARGTAVRWRIDVEGQSMVVDVVNRNERDKSSAAASSSTLSQRAVSGAVRRVSILAPNVDDIESFYGPKGLGLSVVRLSAREVLVDGIFRFLGQDADTRISKGGVYIEVQVDDLEAALSRLQASRSPNSAVVRLKDPAHNDVGVYSRNSNASG